MGHPLGQMEGENGENGDYGGESNGCKEVQTSPNSAFTDLFQRMESRIDALETMLGIKQDRINLDGIVA